MRARSAKDKIWLLFASVTALATARNNYLYTPAGPGTDNPLWPLLTHDRGRSRVKNTSPSRPCSTCTPLADTADAGRPSGPLRDRAGAIPRRWLDIWLRAELPDPGRDRLEEPGRLAALRNDLEEDAEPGRRTRPRVPLGRMPRLLRPPRSARRVRGLGVEGGVLVMPPRRPNCSGLTMDALDRLLRPPPPPAPPPPPPPAPDPAPAPEPLPPSNGDSVPRRVGVWPSEYCSAGELRRLRCRWRSVPTKNMPSSSSSSVKSSPLASAIRRAGVLPPRGRRGRSRLAATTAASRDRPGGAWAGAEGFASRVPYAAPSPPPSPASAASMRLGKPTDGAAAFD